MRLHQLPANNKQLARTFSSSYSNFHPGSWQLDVPSRRHLWRANLSVRSEDDCLGAAEVVRDENGVIGEPVPANKKRKLVQRTGGSSCCSSELRVLLTWQTLSRQSSENLRFALEKSCFDIFSPQCKACGFFWQN